jgi:hypothetical protein
MSAQTETKSGKTNAHKGREAGAIYAGAYTGGGRVAASISAPRKRNRALLLCLLCAEAGWLILVNAWLRLERAYLKLRLFLRV